MNMRKAFTRKGQGASRKCIDGLLRVMNERVSFYISVHINNAIHVCVICSDDDDSFTPIQPYLHHGCVIQAPHPTPKL
jgi:hypothetical protein